MRFLPVLCVLCGSVGVLPLCSDAETNRFFYDALGRLGTVLDASGTNAAIYQYDAVGNMTGIVRKSVSAVNLFYFTPDGGYGNQTVTLQGAGFSATPAQNTVVFGTVTAQVVSASANLLKVLVPTNAVTSQISVISPSGGNTNARNFTVGIGVEVVPSVVAMPGSFSTQFVAKVYGTTNQNVTWNLNGWVPAGSNSSYGLVTTAGLYTLPTIPPPRGIITVHARSAANPDPLKDGIATVTVQTPVGPIYSPTVSSQPGTPNVLGPVYSYTVSSQPGVPDILGPIYSYTVSVGPPP